MGTPSQLDICSQGSAPRSEQQGRSLVFTQGLCHPGHPRPGACTYVHCFSSAKAQASVLHCSCPKLPDVEHLLWLMDIHAQHPWRCPEALSHHDEGDHPCPAVLQDPLAKQCPAELHNGCSSAISSSEGCNNFPFLPNVTPRGPGFRGAEHLLSLLASVGAAGT